jgi:hypothetical protein
MRIQDLPRPWLLAAMTGVPVSVLLERAEEERAEQAEKAWQSALGDHYRRVGSPAKKPARVSLIDSRNLAF